MPTVRVEPSSIELEVLPGETIFAAAGRLGYKWPSACGGQASCKICTFEVHAGADRLMPMSRLERGEIERSFVKTERGGFPLRLACQAIPTGDVVAFRRGVRPKRPLE